MLRVTDQRPTSCNTTGHASAPDQLSGSTPSRNPAGAILVNGGAIAIKGGTATIANTKLIQAKARVPEMVASAKGDGMTTLVQDGILKSIQGLTDFRHVKAVAIK